MTPVLSECAEQCPVCGEVACERDLVYVDEDEAEADALDVSPGDVVCRECAEVAS